MFKKTDDLVWGGTPKVQSFLIVCFEEHFCFRRIACSRESFLVEEKIDLRHKEQFLAVE